MSMTKEIHDILADHGVEETFLFAAEEAGLNPRDILDLVIQYGRPAVDVLRFALERIKKNHEEGNLFKR